MQLAVAKIPTLHAHVIPLYVLQMRSYWRWNFHKVGKWICASTHVFVARIRHVCRPFCSSDPDPMSFIYEPNLNKMDVRREILTPSTLALSCKVVHAKLRKQVHICKSFGEKISGTFLCGHSVYKYIFLWRHTVYRYRQKTHQWVHSQSQ